MATCNPRPKLAAEGVVTSADSNDGVKARTFQHKERTTDELYTTRRTSYRPSPARRVTIDKPDGGTRELGIPNVLDRLIQTAIVLILNQIFDPDFSDSSFGYRPIRSAHGAVKQIQTIIGSKHRWCVDMDLSKFFDRVSHDRLMWRVGRKVRDKRLLKLIGHYLRAGPAFLNRALEHRLRSYVTSRCQMLICYAALFLGFMFLVTHQIPRLLR